MEKSTSNAARSRGTSYANNGLSEAAERAKDTLSDKVSAFASDYPEIEEIRQDWRALSNDVAKLTTHATKDTRAAASNFTSDLLKKLDRQMHDRPAQTIAVAFFGGVLASILLRRR